MFQFSPFLFTAERNERERAVIIIKLLTHFWCRETEYLWYFLSLLNKANILKKWHCCRLFQVITTTKKKKKSSSQFCHKALFFFYLPILELLRSRVRFVKALALSSASWNASLILSSVCVVLVSFLNSMVKRTITLPFLQNKTRKVTKC